MTSSKSGGADKNMLEGSSAECHRGYWYAIHKTVLLIGINHVVNKFRYDILDRRVSWPKMH